MVEDEDDADLERLGVEDVLRLMDGGRWTGSRPMWKWADGEDGRCGCE
jgi:hypothetical protein